MAASLATKAAAVPQLAAAKASVFGDAKSLKTVRAVAVNRKASATVAMAGAPSFVPDMGRRNLMNLLLAGAVAVPGTAVLGGWLYVLVPPGSGGSGGGLVARDAFGQEITAEGWLKAHGPGDRTLAEGLKGDPTYLVVENDGQLAPYGVNAVCTHLGCVVPFNTAENKFMCPCHGSQYDNQGKVVRGPAPLSLALAHVDIVDGKVFFSSWPETDFRTGEAPWWA
ncbi:unnamed protein product [Closterium sp. Naga37s-1]|nr:unnamed protein product [Closterium sp. Naga37s-1]